MTISFTPVCLPLSVCSRNVLLHDEARPKCVVLHESLKWAEKEVQTRQCSLDQLIQEIRKRITEEGGEVDYVKVVDPETLEDKKDLQDTASIVIAVAAFFINKAQQPEVRLIDNILVTLPKT